MNFAPTNLTPLSPPPGAAPPPRVVAALRTARIPLSFVALIGAWLFDFQSAGEGEGLAFQAIFLGVYLFGLAGFLIADRSMGRVIAGMNSFLMAGSIFLAVGIVSGMVHGQQIYPILRNAISVLVYVSIAYVIARAVVSYDLKVLRRFLGIACLAYAVSTFLIYSAMSGGIDVTSVRFQIVGTSTIAALAYVSLSVLFKLNYVELAALGINAVILLLSVTRTYLFAFAAQAAVLLLGYRRLFGAKFLLVVIAGLIALGGLQLFGQSQIERWRGRFVGEGSSYSEYETYYTRLSEWNFMYDSWTSAPREFLIGSGLAAETTYYYSSEQGGGAEHMIGFGHNHYLSTVFTAGALGGLPLLVLQVLQGILAVRFLSKVVRRPDLRSDIVFLGAWGAMIILGTLAANLFLNSYTQRGMALWYGIGTGLLIAAASGASSANAPPAQPRGRRAVRGKPAPRRPFTGTFVR